MLNFHIEIEATKENVPYIRQFISGLSRVVGKTLVTFEGEDKIQEWCQEVEYQAFTEGRVEL